MYVGLNMSDVELLDHQVNSFFQPLDGAFKAVALKLFCFSRAPLWRKNFPHHCRHISLTWVLAVEPLPDFVLFVSPVFFSPLYSISSLCKPRLYLNVKPPQKHALFCCVTPK